jgi:hypothetical protein
VAQQDWATYEALAAESDKAWLRALMPQDKFAIYNDLFTILWNARREGDWERLEAWAWEQKLAMRLKFVEAFRKRDELLRKREAAGGAD